MPSIYINVHQTLFAVALIGVAGAFIFDFNNVRSAIVDGYVCAHRA